MAKFVIQPHGRLQEAVADQNGYFTDEGLDYAIIEREGFGVVRAASDEHGQIMSGAYESYVRGGGHKGQRSDVSCACHWAVNQAAASNIGHMWGGAYVVSPGAIMVRADSDIRTPDDLAGREIAVGFHSGSHFSTIQALESFLAPDQVRLRFLGPPWDRLDACVNGDADAASVWGVSCQVAAQVGLRTVVDCSFMIAFMFPPEVDRRDIEKYMSGLRRAQMEIDLSPEKYKHLFLPQIPERYRTRVDPRRLSTGERIVFLPYTREAFDRTQEWLRQRGLFDTHPAYDFALAVS